MNLMLTQINQTYAEFERDFTEENFPAVFDWIKEFNQLGSFGPGGHPLSFSAPPIFQTPVSEGPKLMLVGNNNSWFDMKDSKKAKTNLEQLAGKLPVVNSYMAHNTSFGRSLRKIFGLNKGDFKGLYKLGVLQDCVGINRMWIQIGSKPKPKGLTIDMDKASKEPSPVLGETFSEYCESRTRELIRVIQPEVLVLIGKAKVLYPDDKLDGIKLIKVRHPAYNHEKEMVDAIRGNL